MSIFQTKTENPSEAEQEKRTKAIIKLKKQKVVYNAIKKIQDFLLKEGLENASINMQIIPEFCKESHKIAETIVASLKGCQYYVNTDLYNTK